MKLSAICALAAIMSCACGGLSAHAQPKSNDNEIILSASLFRPVNSGEGSFNADTLYSYHFNDPRFELGLRQSFVYNFSSDQPDVWNAVTAPFARYNFLSDSLLGISRRPEFVPYVGALLGAVWNDQDATGTTGPEAGVRWYARESTFLILGYRYEWFFDSLGGAERSQVANHVFALGIGFNWGGLNRGPRP
jgi:hypothetical protein